MNDATKQNIFLASAAVCAVALAGMFANTLLYRAPVQSVAGQPNVVVQPLVVLPNGEAPASSDEQLGGLIHNIQESFDAGIAVDGTEVISGTGAITGATALTIGSGTAIDKHVRTTADINVNTIPPQSGTSSVITLTGASTVDHCDVSVTAGDLRSATSSAIVSCMVTAADTATVFYRNSASGTFDAGMSTLSIQATSY